MQKAKLKPPNFKEEQKLWRRGYNFVVGLDEAGRGPLAGPVTAAAVTVRQFPISPGLAKRSGAGQFLPASPASRSSGTIAKATEFKIQNLKKFQNIKDSKKLSVFQREKWYEFLTTHPDIKWGIGIVSEKIIDRINILGATKLAMKKALEALEQKGARAEYLLLDGTFLLDDLSINQKAITRGDEKIWSCAAASIIAKVTRDRLMLKYHQKYPQYGFDKHKGYGTRAHFAAIKKHGPCAIHRRSFAPFK